MRLLLFGPPGVGKGTQARLLAAQLEIPHISTGDMLRAAVAGNSDLGRKARAIMEAGKLVPDDVMIAVVRDVLSSPRTSRGFILDGFPRTLAQAKALSRIFEDLAIREFKVVELGADDEEIIRRLSSRLLCPKEGRIYNAEADGLSAGAKCPECGTPLIQREDDRPDTVRERLRVYHTTTAPVIHYYHESGLVISVDGTGSIDVVNREIRLMLKDTLPA